VKPLVSVIVPCFGHGSVLPKCLTALRQQSYPADRYEVIVIDNSDGSSSLDLSSFPEARVNYEAQPGSYAARNKGIVVARGQIFAFTDADCVPERHWIENGVTQILCLKCPGVIGGRIQITFRDPTAPSIFELFDAALSFQQESYVNNQHFAATANMFVSREVFEGVGPFNSRLKSNGDKEWGLRVFRNNIPQRFGDNVVIEHPARSTLRALRVKTVRLVGGTVDFSHSGGLRQLPSDLYHELRGAALGWSTLSASALKFRRRVLSYSAILTFLTLVRIGEKIRLRAGGTSRRA
jgi:glycosyltransferase involved in cell wall biosynthesis